MRTLFHKTALAISLLIALSVQLDAAYAQTHGPQCSYIEESISGVIQSPVKVLFIGDSIVEGVGDEEKNSGFVGRVQALLPEFHIGSICKAGITSGGVLNLLSQELSGNSCNRTEEALHGADIVIVALGTNDYWLKISPQSTLQRMRDVVTLLRYWYYQKDHATPLIVVSTMINIGDKGHHVFASRLNEILISRSMQGMIAGPRFDLVDFSQFSADGEHPAAVGYTALARIIAKYIVNIALPKLDYVLIKQSQKKNMQCMKPETQLVVHQVLRRRALLN